FSKKMRKDDQNSSTSEYSWRDIVITFHKDNSSDDNINDIPAGNGDGNSEYINYEFLNEKEWGNDDGSRWDDPEDIEAKIKLNQRLKEFSL
ncbi:5886_t:CDS:2, partial [Funneliformis geosporum]